MKKTILKNMRRPFPFFNLFIPVFIKKTDVYKISKDITFTDSAIYHFDDADQYDLNKLFGFSFGLHHKNSVRFGWRPSKDLTKMEIAGHEYVDGKMMPLVPITEVELNKKYTYELEYDGELNKITYSVIDSEHCNITTHSINLKNKYNIGYKLYLYFGGDKKAPHNITIYQINN